MGNLRYTWRTFARELTMIIMGLLWASPFYVLIATSFKNDSETYGSYFTLPSPPTLVPARAAWSGTATSSYPAALMGSIIVTGCSILVLISVGSLTAYALTRNKSRLAGPLYALFVVGLVLPVQLGLIPLYSLMQRLHLTGTYLGLVIFYTGLFLPLTVFLYGGFLRVLPLDYEEAAQVDGARPFRIFRRVAFPLLRPVTGTVAILCGLLIWNDFFTPLVFLSGGTHNTLPMFVYSFVGNQAQRWNFVFAAVLLSIIPLLLFYFFAQRQLIKGFSGGIKS